MGCLAKSDGSIWPGGFWILRNVSLRDGRRRRVRVVAATGCRPFAGLLRPVCLADWCDVPSTCMSGRSILEPWSDLGRSIPKSDRGRPVSWLTDPSRRVPPHLVVFVRHRRGQSRLTSIGGGITCPSRSLPDGGVSLSGSRRFERKPFESVNQPGCNHLLRN